MKRSIPRILSHLDPGLAELGPLGELLPRVDVGVLRPLERLLQLVLKRCEYISLKNMKHDLPQLLKVAQ